MARGQKAKLEIQQKILDTFKDSFLNEKEIRINTVEDGLPIQIKVTLTAAKDIIEDPSNGNMIGTAAQVVNPIVEDFNFGEEPKITEPTPEEKRNVEDLLKALGL